MGDILVHTSIPPPYSIGIWVLGFPRRYSRNGPHLLLASSDVLYLHLIAQELVALILRTSPASNVMRAPDYARLDSLSDPDLVYEPTYFSLNLEQITFRDSEFVSIIGMNPDWIAMSNLDQPLSIGRS